MVIFPDEKAIKNECIPQIHLLVADFVPVSTPRHRASHAESL